MGFRLPITGYVAPRGVGGENAPDNLYNSRNKSAVETQMDRIEKVYDENRESREFTYSDDLDLTKAFRGTVFETNDSERVQLKKIFTSFPNGGFLVTPNLHHIIHADDMTREVVRTHMAKITGFLFTDEISKISIDNMDHIRIMTEMAMKNWGSVHKSIPQPTERSPSRKTLIKRSRAFR